MSNYKTVDLSLDLKPTALAVLHGLAATDLTTPEGCIMTTRAWYNGREKGISLNLQWGGQDSLFIVFGEHKRSDAIFVDNWKGRTGKDGPTVADFTEEAYNARMTFPALRVDLACDYIMALAASYFVK